MFKPSLSRSPFYKELTIIPNSRTQSTIKVYVQGITNVGRKVFKSARFFFPDTCKVFFWRAKAGDGGQEVRLKSPHGATDATLPPKVAA